MRLPTSPRPRLRRLVARAAAVAVAAPALAVLAVQAPADAAPAGRERANVTLTIGTYNIIAKTGPVVFASAVAAVVPQVAVLGLQEVNSLDKERVLNKTPGFRYYRPQAASQTPLMWRDRRFAIAGKRTVMISGRRFVGKEIPGRGTYLPPKYVTVVRLWDRLAHRRVSLINVHLVSGAVKAGVARPHRPLLFGVYRDQIRNLSTLAALERTWGRTYVMGDFNISWRPDRKVGLDTLVYASFRRIGMRSMWATRQPENGTRQTALLDQVYSQSRAKQVYVAQQITYSDHRPAIAQYSLGVR